MGGAVSIGKAHGGSATDRLTATSVVPGGGGGGASGNKKSPLPHGGMSKRKLTMRHTIRLDTVAAQMLQAMVLEMARTGRVELTSTTERDSSGALTGTLSQRGLTSLWRVPEVVLSMPHLTELNLRCNEIASLPKEIAALAALQVLIVSKNKLTVLPEELTHLTKLRVLEVSDNQLTALPEQLGDLTALEELRANRNQLTRLPSSLRSCRGLRVLHVFINALTELTDAVSSLSELEELNASNNQLRRLPSEVPLWKNLRRLLLQVNQLRSLPALDALSNLEVLHLQQNQLQALPSMTSLVHLVKLDANTNCLTKLPVESVAHMTALAYLNLRHNQLTEIPAVLARCQMLEILDLGDNPIVSPVVVALSELSKLRTLLLDGCKLTVLPIELIGLSQVSRVHLGARLYMDDPETCEAVLGLRGNCTRNDGWLKTGDWTDRRTDSMPSDFWECYSTLGRDLPDEPECRAPDQANAGQSHTASS
ncbi:hypothetical protein BBJ28_00017183 [Nothophytophthora sp. Chile5]|nr:hypothetical protein BBJ28_00017183 [Nothophytophthora sp. Chile5]